MPRKKIIKQEETGYSHYKTYLTKGIEMIDSMSQRHRKVMQTRMDFRYPQEMVTDGSNKDFSKALQGLSKELNKDGYDPQYLGRREQNDQPHQYYHLNLLIQKAKRISSFFVFFMKIPAKLFTLHILEFDRNAGDGKNNFYSFLLQISVETFLRALGDDTADHIPGKIQFKKPKCRIHMDFQNRIPRDQTLADSIGDPQTRHRTTASKPAFTKRFGLQICCIAGRGQFLKYQFLREIRVYAFQRAPRV